MSQSQVHPDKDINRPKSSGSLELPMISSGQNSNSMSDQEKKRLIDVSNIALQNEEFQKDKSNKNSNHPKDPVKRRFTVTEDKSQQGKQKQKSQSGVQYFDILDQTEQMQNKLIQSSTSSTSNLSGGENNKDKSEKKQKKKEEKYDDIRDIINQASCFRMCCRVSIHLLIMIAFVASFLFFNYVDRAGGYWYPQTMANADLTVTAQNCMLHLLKSDTKQVWSRYYVKRFQFFQDNPNPIYDGMNSTLSISDSGGKYEIKMVNQLKETKWCWLELYVPQSFSFQNVNFKCKMNSTCYFVQDGFTWINSQKVTFQGEILTQMYANIEDISAKSFDFNGIAGAAHLNFYQFTEASSIKISSGEIALQTSGDVKYLFQSPQQTFCMAGLNPIDSTQISSSCNFFNGIIQSNPLSQTNSNCQGEVSLCFDPVCVNPIQFRVELNSGNIYANNINSQGLAVSNRQSINIVKGAIYNQGLGFEGTFLDSMQQIKNATNSSLADNAKIIGIGKINMHSTSYTKWVHVTNPSYSYLKPWWIAFLSGSFLAMEEYKAEGFLAPGFCPYVPSLNQKNYYDIQQMIYSYFNKQLALTNFVILDGNQQQIKSTAGSDDGVQMLGQDSYQLWLTVSIVSDGSYKFNRISITDRILIPITLALSVFIGLFVGIPAVILFKTVFVIFHDNLKKRTEHATRYTEQIKMQKKQEELQKLRKKGGKISQKKFSINQFYNIEDMEINVSDALKRSSIWQLPRFTTVLDLEAYNAYLKLNGKPVHYFCEFLFRPINEQEKQKIIREQVDPTLFFQLREQDLKNMYEKFCFLNGMMEVPLSEPASMKQLERHGFTLVTDESLQQTFTRIMIQNKPIPPTQQMLETKGSLDSFIRSCYDLTGLQSDNQFISDFVQSYAAFCHTYRVAEEAYTQENLATKYNLNFSTGNRQKLVKLNKNQTSNSSSSSSSSSSQNKKIQELIIDMKMLQMHLTLLSDLDSYSREYELKGSFMRSKVIQFLIRRIFRRPIEAPTNNSAKAEIVLIQTIYYPMWYLVDVVTVVSHVFIVVILTFPVIAVWFYMQFVQSSYRVSDPRQNVVSSSFEIDFWQTPEKVIEMNIVAIIFIVFSAFFILLNFFQEFVIYINSIFPENRIFVEEQRISKNKLYKAVVRVQWLFLMFFFMIISAYVAIIMLWMILGSIINPNNYLVLTTSASTLITLITTQYKDSIQIAEQAYETVKQIVNETLNQQVQAISGPLLREVKEMCSKGGKALDSDLAGDIMNAAQVVGLGDQVAQLKQRAQDTLNNPNKVIQEAKNAAVSLANQDLSLEGMKKDVIDKAIAEFMRKLKNFQIPDDLGDVFKNIIMKDEEKFKENFSNLVAHYAQGKINKNMINWTIGFLSKAALMGPKKSAQEMAIELQSQGVTMIESLLQMIAEQVIPQEQRKIVPKLADFLRQIIQLAQSLHGSKEISIVQSLKEVLLLALDSSNVLESSEMTLVMKSFQFIDLIMQGKANLFEIKEFAMSLLEGFDIDENIGLFLTQMLSKNDQFAWDFQSKRIAGYQQLHIFLNKFFQENLRMNNDKTVSIISQGYICIMKLVRGQLQSQDIEKVLLQLIDLDPNWKLDQLQIEIVKKISGFILLFLNFGKNQVSNLKELSNSFGLDSNIIQELSSLCTGNFFQFFSINRISILQGSEILKIICNQMRFQENELLGLIEIIFGEQRHQFDKSPFVQSFLQTIYDIIKVKNQHVKTLILNLVQLASSKSAIEIYTVLLQIFLLNFKLDKKIQELSQNQFRSVRTEVEQILLDCPDFVDNYMDQSFLLVTDLKERVQNIPKIDPAQVKEKAKKNFAIFIKKGKVKDIFFEAKQLIIAIYPQSKSILDSVTDIIMLKDFIQSTSDFTSNFNQIKDIIEKYSNNFIKHSPSIINFFHLIQLDNDSADSIIYFLKEGMKNFPILSPDKANFLRTAIEHLIQFYQAKDQMTDPAKLIDYIPFDMMPDIIKKCKPFIAQLVNSNLDEIPIKELSDIIFMFIDMLPMENDQKIKIKKLLTLLFNWKHINPRKIIEEFFPDADQNEGTKMLKEIFIHILGEDYDKLLKILEDKVVKNFLPEENRKDLRSVLQMIWSFTFSSGDKGLSDLQNTFDHSEISSIKLFLCRDPKLFIKFFIKLFKQKFGINAISADLLTNILSLYTLKPNFQIIAQALKIPQKHIEIPYYIAKMWLYPNQQDTLNEIAESTSFKSFLRDIDINEEEFLLIMKFFTRSTDQDMRQKFIKKCNLDQIMEPSLIRGLFSIASPFEIPIISSQLIRDADLQKQYKIHYNNRMPVYQILSVHLACPNFDPSQNINQFLDNKSQLLQSRVFIQTQDEKKDQKLLDTSVFQWFFMLKNNRYADLLRVNHQNHILKKSNLMRTRQINEGVASIVGFIEFSLQRALKAKDVEELLKKIQNNNVLMAHNIETLLNFMLRSYGLNPVIVLFLLQNQYSQSLMNEKAGKVSWLDEILNQKRYEMKQKEEQAKKKKDEEQKLKDEKKEKQSTKGEKPVLQGEDKEKLDNKDKQQVGDAAGLADDPHAGGQDKNKKKKKVGGEQENPVVTEFKKLLKTFDQFDYELKTLLIEYEFYSEICLQSCNYQYDADINKDKAKEESQIIKYKIDTILDSKIMEIYPQDYSGKSSFQKVNDVVKALFNVGLQNTSLTFLKDRPVTAMIVLSSLKAIRKLHQKDNQEYHTSQEEVEKILQKKTFHYQNMQFTLTVQHVDLLVNALDKINYMKRYHLFSELNRPQLVKAISIPFCIDLFTRDNNEFDQINQKLTTEMIQIEIFNVVQEQNQELKKGVDKMMKVNEALNQFKKKDKNQDSQKQLGVLGAPESQLNRKQPEDEQLGSGNKLNTEKLVINEKQKRGEKFKPLFIFDGLIRKSLGKLRVKDFEAAADDQQRILPTKFDIPEEAKAIASDPVFISQINSYRLYQKRDRYKKYYLGIEQELSWDYEDINAINEKAQQQEEQGIAPKLPYRLIKQYSKAENLDAFQQYYSIEELEKNNGFGFAAEDPVTENEKILNVFLHQMLLLPVPVGHTYANKQRKLGQFFEHLAILAPEMIKGNRSERKIILKLIFGLRQAQQFKNESLGSSFISQKLFETIKETCNYFSQFFTSNIGGLLNIIEMLVKTQLDYNKIQWFIENALDGKGECFYGLIYPLFVSLKQDFDISPNKIPSIFNINAQENSNYSGAYFGETDQNQQMRTIFALQQLLENSDFDQSQMKLIVILIMCFIGDDNAWMNLLHETVPQLQENPNSPESQIITELLRRVIAQLKSIKMESGTIDNLEAIIQGNIFELIGKQSADQVISMLLQYLEQRIQTDQKTQMTEKLENLLKLIRYCMQGQYSSIAEVETIKFLFQGVLKLDLTQHGWAVYTVTLLLSFLGLCAGEKLNNLQSLEEFFTYYIIPYLQKNEVQQAHLMMMALNLLTGQYPRVFQYICRRVTTEMMKQPQTKALAYSLKKNSIFLFSVWAWANFQYLISGIEIKSLSVFIGEEFSYMAEYNLKEINITILLSYAALRIFRYIPHALNAKQALQIINSQAAVYEKFIQYNMVYLIDLINDQQKDYLNCPSNVSDPKASNIIQGMIDFVKETIKKYDCFEQSQWYNYDYERYEDEADAPIEQQQNINVEQEENKQKEEQAAAAAEAAQNNNQDGGQEDSSKMNLKQQVSGEQSKGDNPEEPLLANDNPLPEEHAEELINDNNNPQDVPPAEEPQRFKNYDTDPLEETAQYVTPYTLSEQESQQRGEKFSQMTTDMYKEYIKMFSNLIENIPQLKKEAKLINIILSYVGGSGFSQRDLATTLQNQFQNIGDLILDMPRFQNNQKQAAVMKITIQSVSQLIIVGTQALSNKLKDLEKPHLKRNQMLVQLIINLSQMIQAAPPPINQFQIILQIFSVVFSGQKVDNKLFKEMLESIIPVLLEFSGVQINHSEIVDRIVPIIEIYEDVNIFMRDYSKTGFQFERFKNLLSRAIKVAVGDPKRASIYISIIDSIQALTEGKLQNLNYEFFLFLKVNPNHIKDIKFMIGEFSNLISNSDQFVQSITNMGKRVFSQKDTKLFSKLQELGDKINDQLSIISNADMFVLADSSGDGFINANEFRRFAKRIGITLTDHRALEVISFIKQGSGQKGVELDQEQFEQAVQYIQSKSIVLSLEAMGVTQELMMWALIYFAFLLVLIIAFILVGVNAFGIPGMFGSLINSVFPMAGGNGLNGAQQIDIKELLDIQKLQPTVEQIISTVQSQKL